MTPKGKNINKWNLYLFLKQCLHHPPRIILPISFFYSLYLCVSAFAHVNAYVFAMTDFKKNYGNSFRVSF